jgi:hypothetical protein
MGVPSVKTIKERLELRKTHLGDRAATITRQAMEWAEGLEPGKTLVDYVEGLPYGVLPTWHTHGPFDWNALGHGGFLGAYSDRIRAALGIIDSAIEGFGVEYIPSEQDTFHSVRGLEYVNQGDTYTPTVYYDHGTGVWHVGDWGTVVELHPARFR